MIVVRLINKKNKEQRKVSMNIWEKNKASISQYSILAPDIDSSVVFY